MSLNPLAVCLRAPLSLRVIVGVILGIIVGFSIGDSQIAFGWTASDFTQIAGMYVQLLTAMATPLIFLAIIDGFLRTEISGRLGLKMVCICCLNVVVAFTIGLYILNVWTPGRAWRTTFKESAAKAADTTQGAETAVPKPPTNLSLSPLEIVKSLIPKNIVQPFQENMVLTIAALAISIGVAIRSLKRTADPDLASAITTLDQVFTASFQVILKLLMWLIELAPFAIFLAVSGVIGKSGSNTFELVGVFLLTVCAGLMTHSMIYYPISVWLATGRSPLTIFRYGGKAILTGFSLNSSLATASLTLEALKKMGVSDSSARLSACVGTNFNNDGITLYEALTALFIAQAVGIEASIDQQLTILLAALVGSMGIAGIPNSGLIILALVLKAARLPDWAITLAMPLVYSVDFLLARLRSAVNVMGDMQVALLLDGRPPVALPVKAPDDLIGGRENM